MQEKVFTFKIFEKFRNNFIPFLASSLLGGVTSWILKGYVGRIGLLSFLGFMLLLWLFMAYCWKRAFRFSFDSHRLTISGSFLKSSSSVVRYEKYILVDPKARKPQPWLVLEVWMGKGLFSFTEKLDATQTDLPAFRIADPPVQYRCLKPGTIEEIAAMIDEFNRNREG